MEEFISATDLIGDPATALTLLVKETSLLPERFLLLLLNNYNLLECSIFYIELKIDVPVADCYHPSNLSLTCENFTSNQLQCWNQNPDPLTPGPVLFRGPFKYKSLSAKLSVLHPLEHPDFIKTDCTEDFILNTKEKIPRVLPRQDLVHPSQCSCSPLVTLPSSIALRTRDWVRTILHVFLRCAGQKVLPPQLFSA